MNTNSEYCNNDKSEYADRYHEDMERLEGICSDIVLANPFFGYLLLHLNVGFAQCGTAYTEGTGIFIDRQFFSRISDSEASFVIMHEILHIAHGHCFRAKGYIHYIMNLAADIVVNSEIMEIMGIKSMTIDKCEIMHLTPDKKEGRLFTSEEVYYKLLENMAIKYGSIETGKSKNDILEKQIRDAFGDVDFDKHDNWKEQSDSDYLAEKMEKVVKDAIDEMTKKGYASSCRGTVRNIIREIEKKGKIQWSQVLKSYLNEICNKPDYTFSPPDRRMDGMDVFLPDFFSSSGDYSIDGVWFVVDSSGSIDDKHIDACFNEIKSCIMEINNIEGYISFFNTRVSTPVHFESVEDLNAVGLPEDGGTDFHAIFEYMKYNMSDKLPRLVIILTDGGAEYPPEGMAMGIPVIWVIEEGGIRSPWGICVDME